MKEAMITCEKVVDCPRKCQCPWNEEQLKVHLEDLLAMYEEGIYDLSVLTVMLLDCPAFNAGEFIRGSISYEKRWNEVEKIKNSRGLTDSTMRRLEEFYVGSLLKDAVESRKPGKGLSAYYAVLKSKSSCHVAEGLHMKKMPVIFKDNHYETVTGNELDKLLETGKLKAFRRSTGWVVIGRDALRGSGGMYVGPDRRMPGRCECFRKPTQSYKKEMSDITGTSEMYKHDFGV